MHDGFPRDYKGNKEKLSISHSAHRSRMNPSRSKVIVKSILLDTNTKVTSKDIRAR